MKKIMTMLAMAGMLGAGANRALAHDDGWSTAGKILTGLAAAHVVAHAVSHGPVYHGPVVYSPPPVYVSPPVCVTPTPVVVHPAPPRVIYAPPPVRIYRPPVVSVHVGIGKSHCHRPLHSQRFRHPHHR